MKPPRSIQAGVIYLAMLLTVAALSGVSAMGLRVAKTIQQRQAESELLWIGQAFRNALQSYAEATPNGLPNTPESLAELLRDPRSPGIKRHLREIYRDPFTGNQDWGIVRGPDRRIVGIHSLDAGEVLKQQNHPMELAGLSAAKRHSDWIFTITTQPQALNQASPRP